MTPDEEERAEAKRIARALTLDESIARHLEEASASGELASAAHYGKPFPADRGFDETPAELRMAMKILKDANAPPAEIEWFHQRARLRAELDAATDEPARQRAAQRLAEVEQKIALRLESLRLKPRL